MRLQCQLNPDKSSMDNHQVSENPCVIVRGKLHKMVEADGQPNQAALSDVGRFHLWCFLQQVKCHIGIFGGR